MDNRWTIDGICCTSHVVSHLRRAPIEVCFPHWHSGTTCPSASSQGTCHICNRRHLMTSVTFRRQRDNWSHWPPPLGRNMLRCLPHLHRQNMAKHAITGYHQNISKYIKIHHVGVGWILWICCEKIARKSKKSRSLHLKHFFSAGFFLHFVPSWKKESKGPSKKPNCRPHRFAIGAWFVRAILAVAIVVIDGGSCYLPIQDANWSVQTTANLKICSKLNNSNCKIFTSTYLSPLRSTSWPLQRKPWAYWPCISGATPDFINSHGLAVWHDEIWRVGWGWWPWWLVLSAFCDEKQRRSFRWDSKKTPRCCFKKKWVNQRLKRGSWIRKWINTSMHKDKLLSFWRGINLIDWF